MNQIKKAYISLENEIKNYDKTESQEYHNYLITTFQDVKNDLKVYQIEQNNPNFNKNNTLMDLSFFL